MRCPIFLLVRECLIRVEQPGFRTRTVIIATTLLDPVEFTKEDLGRLYRSRWNAEIDLRSLKRTLQMDILRCKTPELVPEVYFDDLQARVRMMKHWPTESSE